MRDLEMTDVVGITAGPTTQPDGIDSTSFSWIGLNGIGFLQDPLEYGTRTHHSNMDLQDRGQKGRRHARRGDRSLVCLQRSATRADLLPRLETPAPAPDKTN